jgi:hypothetical protein
MDSPSVGIEIVVDYSLLLALLLRQQVPFVTTVLLLLHLELRVPVIILNF